MREIFFLHESETEQVRLSDVIERLSFEKTISKHPVESVASFERVSMLDLLH